MKDSAYRVWFTNGDYRRQAVTVHAMCQQDAIILASAERIKRGLDYTLFAVETIE